MDKKYDFHKVEQELEQMWEENKIYKYQNSREKKVFSIDTPPPTVSGKLHIGHVFSYTQAEMIARFKRMQGYDVFYPFGFDDNGLPTERLVEKEVNIRFKNMKQSLKICGSVLVSVWIGIYSIRLFLICPRKFLRNPFLNW